jgi:hypothetical protein
LAKYGETGRLSEGIPVSTNCWPVAQVPIQVSVADAVCHTQEILNIKTTIPAAIVFFDALIFITVSSGVVEIPLSSCFPAVRLCSIGPQNR